MVYLPQAGISHFSGSFGLLHVISGKTKYRKGEKARHVHQEWLNITQMQIANIIRKS